ncbi:SCP2 sterol-binding domain-containing protein [Oceanobacillus sp. CAU 1775]
MENLSLNEVMQEIEKRLNENPEPIHEVQSLYQFEISGEEEGVYQLDIQNGTAKVSEGVKADADCTLKMSLKNFHKFLAGNLNGTVAFMTGKLKLDGDMTKALKLESLLKKYKLSE